MTVKIKVKDKLEDDTLDLSFCELKEVPIREIAMIKKASHLDLSNNQLVSLPDTIVTLSHIVKLDISKNMLTEIPENIGDMRQLRHLDLYSNQISRLPLSIGDLKNLKWLDLKDNPLTPAIANVAGTCSNSNDCQACARKIVAFFSKLKDTIEEEKKRRVEKTASTSTADGSSKKENKKKKNNAEKKKQVEKIKSRSIPELAEAENGAEQLNNELKENLSANGSSSEKICGLFGSIVCSIMLPVLMFAFIISLLAFILPLYDPTLSENIVNYLEVQTNWPIKHYLQLGILKKDLMIENVLDVTKKTMIFLEILYKNISIGHNE